MTADPIDVEVLFQGRTRAAVRVQPHEGGADVWLPLSQIRMDPPDPLMANEVVTVRAPEWLLKEKGLM